MKKQTPVEELNRTDIIYELARYAHPTWYQYLPEWPTHYLRGLLAYYRAARL